MHPPVWAATTALAAVLLAIAGWRWRMRRRVPRELTDALRLAGHPAGDDLAAAEVAAQARRTLAEARAAQSGASEPAEQRRSDAGFPAAGPVASGPAGSHPSSSPGSVPAGTRTR